MNTMIELRVFDRMTALGDLTRSRILVLLEQNELTVSELMSVIQLPQSTVSRHLKVLADDGWVTSRTSGTSRYYRMSTSLEPDARELWDLVRVEVMQSGTDTDHIDDGIDGTNLMEVHTIGRQAMDGRLSLCKGGEHRQHAGGRLRRRRVDPGDLRVGDVGAEDVRVGLIGAIDVVGVRAAAGQEPVILAAAHRRADTGAGHLTTPRASRPHRP